MKRLLGLLCALLFSVPAFATLPQAAINAGYTEVEYIQSSGTQWIDTVVVPNQDTSVRLDAQYLNYNSGSNGILFGARTSATANVYVVQRLTAGNWNMGYNNSSVIVGSADTNRHIFYKNKQYQYLDEELKGTGTYSAFTCPGTAILFGLNNNGTPQTTDFPAKVYSLKIYDNDTLVLDLVPVKKTVNGTDVYGMYNVLDSNPETAFYGNKGTGNFTGGNPVCPNGGTAQTYTSATGTVTVSGTPTPTNPIEPIFYTQGDMVLRKIANYADSYDASTGKITRRVGVKIFDGTEALIMYAGNYIKSDAADVVVVLSDARQNNQSVSNAFVYNDSSIWNIVGYPNKWVLNPMNDLMQLHVNIANDVLGITDYTQETQSSVIAKAKAFFKRMYDAGTPVTMYYPLKTEVEETWSELYCSLPIKIATTKYNTNAFSGVVTALSNAVDTIKTVVANTINQATAVANLQSGKQTKPTDTCPAGKTCLLVEDMNGDPHWYEIVESYYNPTLPSGYTELAYIESTGTQWINTGVTTANSISTVTKFEARVAYTSNAGNTRQFIGVYNNYNVAHYCEITSNKYGVNAGGGYYSPTLTANTLYDIIMQVNGSTSTWYNINVNGTDYSKTITQYQNSTMGTFYLFGDSTSSSGFKAANALRIYSAKITVGGTLVRNFIPARRNSDGVLGMYDTVNGQFYTNAGTGEFTAGPVVQ